MKPRACASALPRLALVLASPAASLAQSVNVDVGLNLTYPAPSDLHPGAAGQPGRWNEALPSAGTTALVALDDTPLAATLTATGGTALQSVANLVGAPLDVRELLADVSDPGASPALWSFDGLADGDYLVFTYAMAPDNLAFRTDVQVFGSPDGVATVGGAWSGAYVEGVTHARHRVRVQNASPIVVGVERAALPVVNYASVNGFQLVRLERVGAFCAGDGLDPAVTTPCPCGNVGGPGRGCANSVEPAGARLDWTGMPELDTLVLSIAGTPAAASCVWLQGDGPADVLFGDGVRCVGGALVRLASTSNVNGTGQFPEPGDPSISSRGAVVPGSGAAREYQTYYRNAAAAFCPPALVNVSNGVRVVW
ncbi:MAG: hypothetical protein IPJ77_12075 [Planctomycetes bacterium]|nr:hypothetical protein [Planctomycetota bacterium]